MSEQDNEQKIKQVKNKKQKDVIEITNQIDEVVVEIETKKEPPKRMTLDLKRLRSN